jgi:hypothetical protein
VRPSLPAVVDAALSAGLSLDSLQLAPAVLATVNAVSLQCRVPGYRALDFNQA